MKYFPRLLVMMVVVALLLSACAVASRNALIGKWSATSSNMTMNFTIGGVVEFSSQGATVEIPYQFLTDNSIVLKASPFTSTEDTNVTFTINGDNLTLDLGSGQPLEMTRVK